MANETKETIILELKIQDGAGKNLPAAKKEVEALATSILGLQQANKKFREERRLVDLSTSEGIKKVEELNKKIQENDEIIKKNSTTLEKQRLNIGNYPTTLDKVKESTAGLTSEFAGLLNPVTALITAGAGLVKMYASSTVGAKDLAKAQDTLTSAFEFTSEAVGGFVSELTGGEKGGPGILERFTNEILYKISPALQTLSSFAAAGKEQLRELEISSKFAQQFAKDDERRAELQRRIRDDETNSLNQRISAANQINSILEISAQRSIAVMQAQIEAIKNTTANYNNNREAQLKVAEIEAEIADKREEITGKLTENVTALADLRKQYDDEQELRDRRKIDTENELLSVREINFQKESELLLEAEINTKASIQRIAKIRTDQRTEEEKAEKKASDTKRKNKENELKGEQEFVAESLALSRTAFGKNKAVAIGEAVINTITGITRAFRDYAFPYSLVIAALTGAAGFAQVNEIRKTNYARGGRVNLGPKLAKGGHFKVGGRPHSQGGTKYYGEDGNQFEVERGEGIYVMKRDAEEVAHLSTHNMRHGGRSWEPRGSYPAMQSFALGGSVPSVSPQRGLTAADVRDIVASMPPPIVTVEDINTGQANRAEVTEKANII